MRATSIKKEKEGTIEKGKKGEREREEEKEGCNDLSGVLRSIDLTRVGTLELQTIISISSVSLRVAG